MIYTITFNPALDFVIEIQKFQTGEINRSEQEHILAGGKGINVSIILKMLGINSTTLGFIAGFVGDEIERKVKEYGIYTDFIKIENDNSRINVKIAIPSEETAINARGPLINENHIELLYKKLENIQKDDILILAGSIPKGISENVYQKICEKVSRKGAKIVVDATGELLLKTLPYHPFLIKPNQDELGELFNIKISNQEEAIEYAQKLQLKGSRNVLVSMGKEGAILLDENGNLYRRNGVTTSKRKNTVGAGDSMVAGFIAGYELFGNYEKALDLGTAAAIATVKSISLATKEEIYKIFNQGNII